MVKLITAQSLQDRTLRTFGQFASPEAMQRLELIQPSFFYHRGVTSKGKVEIMGPESKEDAERFAGELEDGEVFELDTRQLAKAVQQIKAEDLKRGIAHDLVLQRTTHIHKGDA